MCGFNSERLICVDSVRDRPMRGLRFRRATQVFGGGSHEEPFKLESDADAAEI
jgi:hypothetical protein